MNRANNSGWYFWKRKTKTERAKKIDRAIATYAGNSRWRQYGYLEKILEKIRDVEDVEKIKADENIEWGEKRSFRYIRDGEKTEWLMREYILDSSRVKVGRDDDIVFCKIYKKRGGCPESPHVGSSDGIPQPDQMIQNAAASSTTLEVPSPWGTHSGDDTLSRMYYLQSPTASFSTVEPRTTDIFSTLPPVDEFSDFDFDQIY
ncbi:hypothetical protein SLEP1_g53696 [Rubroshorea leprosula]|uniref:NAC domain-containing protein n=1 Tax=Rubroshorea leprosula TaxID=152421 RepID=A0AAV5ME21_9ROSI|nr:hypothetical protein SLEP1_g53696 [Rubroshorea leprosula]